MQIILKLARENSYLQYYEFESCRKQYSSDLLSRLWWIDCSKAIVCQTLGVEDEDFTRLCVSAGNTVADTEELLCRVPV
jgi:hypothetical protein